MNTPDLLTVLILGLIGLAVLVVLRARRRTLSDPKVQLGLVSTEVFSSRSVLGHEELQILQQLERWCAEQRAAYRVFPQVSMGEYLSVEEGDAYKSINSKRVDFLIVDRRTRPMIAVEYQGGGHYQGTAEWRDKVKATALQSAGIALVEVFPEDNPNRLHSKLSAARKSE
jgi:hypothetical protein